MPSPTQNSVCVTVCEYICMCVHECVSVCECVRDTALEPVGARDRFRLDPAPAAALSPQRQKPHLPPSLSRPGILANALGSPGKLLCRFSARWELGSGVTPTPALTSGSPGEDGEPSLGVEQG